jgi:hypothetical protein
MRRIDRIGSWVFCWTVLSTSLPYFIQQILYVIHGLGPHRPQCGVYFGTPENCSDMIPFVIMPDRTKRAVSWNKIPGKAQAILNSTGYATWRRDCREGLLLTFNHMLFEVQSPPRLLRVRAWKHVMASWIRTAFCWEAEKASMNGY